MPDGSDFGVTPASGATTSAFLAYNPIFTSLDAAISLGELSKDQTSLGITSSLSQQAPNDTYAFDFSGDTIKLDLAAGLTNPDFGIVTPHVQLLDITGNVIADNQGNDAQIANYAALNSANGLAASGGKYYLKVGYGAGSAGDPQAYSAQLYSGTTYQDNFITTALIQPYDPNLFVASADSITPSSNLQLYTRTANLVNNLTASGTSAAPINIGTVTNNDAELFVSGQTTSTVPTDNYNFNVQQGGAIKLSLTNSTDTAALDVQLLDANGNVLADNNGTDAQKAAYVYLTSGAGLQASAGQYSLKVGFAAGELTGSPQSYNFQINQGTVYNTVYKTGVVQPAAASTYSAGGGLNVYASSDAQLFTRQQFNQIGATASAALNIGWLKENATSLLVQSRLTTADNTDYYNFTLQQGSAFKLGFSNLTDSSVLHVQILDRSGSRVIADNQGSSDQKAAFAQLTSDTGIAASPGQYIVKVSYADGADRSKNKDYSFQLYSGTSYTSLDKTTASAQTIQNLLLSGGTLGYSPASAAASLLTSVSNGDKLDIFNSVSLFSTNLFA